MSIFPGMGYVYSNRVQTALSAFVINGLFMFATYTSFKNDNIGAGSLFGLFGVTFYASGIIGSIKSTKRHNQNKYNNKIKKIQTYY